MKLTELRLELRSIDRRIAFALAYTAVTLTLMEYFFIPSAVYRHEWMRGLEPHTRSLGAGLVFAGAMLVLFLLVPAAVVRYGHRENLASVGWSPRGFVRHLPVYLALFAIVLPFVVLASQRPDFARVYPYVSAARSSIPTFIVWECAYVATFIATEAFFRGYLLFTCAARMGWTAIFVMLVPYTMIHFHKPFPEAMGAIVAGTVLGALALSLRSFWGGAFVHALVAVTMDVLAVRRGGLF